jgi:hypothetical protein
VTAAEEVIVIESIGIVVRLLVETLAAALRPLAELISAPMSAEPGAVALAAAVVTTLALLVVAVALVTAPAHVLTTAAHPRRAIADDTVLAQTHPDAPGHSRPRAPGFAALAA